MARPREQPTPTQSLQSLERGIAVIQLFSHTHPALTLSEVAQMTGLTRATARRILLTLQKLGHMRQEGRLFFLTPRVLSLGWAYLASLSLEDVALPLMQELASKTGESCSATTLDLPDIVYVARVPTSRIMSVTLGIGSRLPAHATSMGRVLLTQLTPEELDAYLTGPEIHALTPRTVTDPVQLRAIVEEVRANGWAYVDQELEMGLHSVAAPVTDGEGRAVAALNVSGAVARTTPDDLRGRFLPDLLATAREISLSLVRSGADGLRRGAADTRARGRTPRPRSGAAAAAARD
jgi:IclR family pca regulon transcriptional regulator